MPFLSLFVLVLGYYLAWFSCVYYAALDQVWLGFIIALVVSAIQSAIIIYHRAYRAFLLALLVFVSGILVDNFLSLTGFIVFYANPWSLDLIPPWIIGVWMSFSLTYSSTWSKMLHCYYLTALSAFFGFSVAYLAGIYLGAGEFTFGQASCVIFGLIWSMLLPLLNFIYLNWLGGRTHVVDS